MFVLGGRIAGHIDRLYYYIRNFTISKFTCMSGQNDPENIYC